MSSGFDPGPINVNVYKWRPIGAGLVTLQEMETHWSINDLADAHEYLDLTQEREAYDMNRHQRELEQKGRKRG